MLVSAPPPSAREASSLARRREAAAFLRGRREALRPEALGLRATARRRTPGLLREEVAQRGGVSLTWYTWLEQARDVHPSADLIERLAGALVLSQTERDYLHRLFMGPHYRELTQAASPSLQAWLDGLAPQAAYALNGAWDVIAWNAGAVDLLGELATISAEERNLLRLIFLHPPWRRRFVDWERIATSATAQFRSVVATYGEAPRVAAVLNELRAESPQFADLWKVGAVEIGEVRSKRFDHPTRGAIDLTYASLRPEGAPHDVSVTVYAA